MGAIEPWLRPPESDRLLVGDYAEAIPVRPPELSREISHYGILWNRPILIDVWITVGALGCGSDINGIHFWSAVSKHLFQQRGRNAKIIGAILRLQQQQVGLPGLKDRPG